MIACVCNGRVLFVCMCVGPAIAERNTVQECSAKQLDVARLAVRIVAMFFESALVQQLQAESASKVLRMPFSTHG